MNGSDQEPGHWPHSGPTYVIDVLKALVVQMCIEVVRHLLGMPW
jgi:hypothetical protein